MGWPELVGRIQRTEPASPAASFTPCCAAMLMAVCRPTRACPRRAGWPKNLAWRATPCWRCTSNCWPRVICARGVGREFCRSRPVARPPALRPDAPGAVAARADADRLRTDGRWRWMARLRRACWPCRRFRASAGSARSIAICAMRQRTGWATRRKVVCRRCARRWRRIWASRAGALPARTAADHWRRAAGAGLAGAATGRCRRWRGWKTRLSGRVAR